MPGLRIRDHEGMEKGTPLHGIVYLATARARYRAGPRRRKGCLQRAHAMRNLLRNLVGPRWTALPQRRNAICAADRRRQSMSSEVFLIIARDVQEFIGGQVWMDKMKETPSEQDFREWEAEGIA